MNTVSLADTSIVSCGTLSLELNYLKNEGLLDTPQILYTTPGLHQDIPELERQLVRRINKAKEKTDKVIAVGKPVKFIFPSSVAIYGMPDIDTKIHVGAVREAEWNTPITMYGWNKLYCEGLGHYYTHHYQQLSAQPQSHKVDFRSLRFPGLISAFTLPTGGTSDYGPEMIHHAAQGKPYPCFVREDTRMPFMAMPDAIKSLLEIANAPRDSLKTHAYNVTAFNPSAGEIFELVKQHFPEAAISFEPDTKRQQIVDSWPADQNDNRARHDWGWQPDYDLERAFDEYLVPNIKQRYES